MKDWIAILEAAYDLGGTLEGWLDALAGAAGPLLDRGLGTSAQAFQVTPAGVRFEGIGVAGAPDALKEQVRASIRGVGKAGVDLVYRSAQPAGSLSEIVFGVAPGEQRRFAATQAGAFQDVIGIVAQAGEGGGVCLNAPMASTERMSPAEKARWRRVALHVGAAYRLRRALHAAASLDDADVEAVLEPSGAVRDARSRARGANARERLRRAVTRIERARTSPGRTDPDDALGLWQGLVAGRWSLVDHFDTDGRRFLVARRNPPGHDDPRGLASRELQIAELLGFGHTPKEIAYALGLSPSTVTNALARARAKLGLSQAELAVFFSPAGWRQRLREIELAGEPLAIGSIPLAESPALARLTASEREVALLALRGATNREIARRRTVSEHTVANQLRSIFAKTGVSSRMELGAALGGAMPAAGDGAGTDVEGAPGGRN